MYICNKRTKVIHKKNCGFARRICGERKIKARDIKTYIDDGYRFCEHCARMERALYKEEDSIKEFCKGKKLSYSFTDDHLVIRTPYGIWRAVPDSDAKGYVLWHQNGKQTRKVEIFEHFHYQKYFPGKLIHIFRYIEQHDMYREQCPVGIRQPKVNPNLGKGGKRYKKQQKRIAKYEAKRDRLNNMNNVWFLLEQISAGKCAV